MSEPMQAAILKYSDAAFTATKPLRRLVATATSKTFLISMVSLGTCREGYLRKVIPPKKDDGI